MDKAKEIYLLGKEKLVSAEEIKKKYLNTVPYKQKHFICSCCGEYVTYVRRTYYKSYFKHANENELTKLCELKSNFDAQFSIYERTGLPLYLKKTGDKIYELYVGFYSIEEGKYNRLINENGNISIKSYKENMDEYCNFNLNENNFSNNNTILKKIDFISSKYRIYYSTENIQRILKNTWGNEIDGIQSSGALFSFSENGGKKIKVNEDVTTNTEYLYLGKSDKLFDFHKGIKSELIGSILFNMNYGVTTYNIYKIILSAYEENDFKNLSEFCRDKFKLSLIYKPAKIISMWPPTIISNQGIKYVNNEKESLCILENDEGTGSLYLHYSSDVDVVEGEEISTNKYLVKIPIKNYKIPITINEKYNSIYTFNNGYIDNVKQHKNEVKLLDKNNKEITIQTKTKLPPKKIIKIEAISRCKVIRVKKNNIYLIHKITNEEEFYIDNIEFGDRILITDSLKETILLEYKRDERLINNNIDDEKVLLRLSKLEEPYIGCPVWIKKVLLIVRNRPKTYALVHNYIVCNRVPIKALKFLNQIWNKR